MNFFELLGMVVSASILLFVALYVAYRVLKKEAEPVIEAQNMPDLKPVPIPTRNCRPGTKTLVWMFEVRRWTLSANWIYTLKDGTRLIVPEGFTFDGASIPRLFWGVLSPVGLLLIPGLIHDYGYKYDQIWKIDEDGKVKPYKHDAGKSFWDNLFLEIGRDVNGFLTINIVAWLGVALGGRASWEKHRIINEPANKPQIS